MHPVRVGCSGWQYDSWRGRLYPEGLGKGRWLERYAEVFDTVEVNSTFYRLASRDAVARWVEQTPPDFVFAAKASRYLTHVKRLRGLAEGIERFCAPLEPLFRSHRLGPILWQLPETFHRDDARLSEALRRLPPGKHCLEVRHPSWFDEDVYSLLRDHGVALVLAHHPSRPFQEWRLTAPWTYVRFHHGARGRRGNYSARELEHFAARIERLGVESWVYFNNDWEAFAVRNALALSGLLASGAGARPRDPISCAAPQATSAGSSRT